MTSKRILFGCYEIPGDGGANTASYQLFHLMQQDGYEVHYMNLIDEQDAAFFEFTFGSSYGNPLSLTHAYNCLLTGVLYGPHPELSARVDELAPDVIVAVDFIAALLMNGCAQNYSDIFDRRLPASQRFRDGTDRQRSDNARTNTYTSYGYASQKLP